MLFLGENLHGGGKAPNEKVHNGIIHPYYTSLDVTATRLQDRNRNIVFACMPLRLGVLAIGTATDFSAKVSPWQACYRNPNVAAEQLDELFIALGNEYPTFYGSQANASLVTEITTRYGETYSYTNMEAAAHIEAVAKSLGL